MPPAGDPPEGDPPDGALVSLYGVGVYDGVEEGGDYFGGVYYPPPAAGLEEGFEGAGSYLLLLPEGSLGGCGCGFGAALGMIPLSSCSF